MRVGESHCGSGIRRRTRESFPGCRDAPVDTLPDRVTALLDKRLIFVTGKGGVGKTTVATALGIVAARRGLRTIVAEVAAQDRVTRAFGGDGQPEHEVEVRPGLFAISIDPQRAMEEYLVLHIPLRPLAQILARSHAFGPFAVAAPGMRELLTMGKIWELAQLERRSSDGDVYDLVIVDAPATGHGVAFMQTPRTFAEVAQVGPIARQGRRIDSFIRDAESTGVVAVALPEEMPVSETLMLRDLLAERLGLGLDLLVVNALGPDRFTARNAGRMRRCLDTTGPPAARAALVAALADHLHAAEQRRQVARLSRGCDQDPVTLPFLLSDPFVPADYEVLATGLEAAL